MGIWVETFFNTDDKTYAALDMIYDYETQDFIGQPSIQTADER
jgi:hypothetical protein